jgi:undecaprenyl-diphosphatase
MTSFDHALFLSINLGPSAPGWAVVLAKAASLNLPQWLAAGTLALALAGQPEWRTQAWRALLAMVLASAAVYLMKRGLTWPRPFALGLGTQWLPHGASPGFPSAHVGVTTAWAVSASLARPRLGALFGGVALLVGWSRVALGLHFPLDVLAAWALGAWCALLVQAGGAGWSRARTAWAARDGVSPFGRARACWRHRARPFAASDGGHVAAGDHVLGESIQ